jgi:hypothetical protein
VRQDELRRLCVVELQDVGAEHGQRAPELERDRWQRRVSSGREDHAQVVRRGGDDLVEQGPAGRGQLVRVVDDERPGLPRGGAQARDDATGHVLGRPVRVRPAFGALRAGRSQQGGGEDVGPVPLAGDQPARCRIHRCGPVGQGGRLAGPGRCHDHGQRPPGRALELRLEPLPGDLDPRLRRQAGERRGR